MSIVTYNNRSIANISAIPGAAKSLTHIKTLTASSSSTLSFVDGSSDVVLDSTYPIYVFKFINIHPATKSDFAFQVSINGGSSYGVAMTTTIIQAFTYENSSYAASYSGLNYRSADDQANGTAFQRIGIPATDNDQCCNGKLTLFNPSSNVFVKHFICDTNSSTTDGSNDPFPMDQKTAGYVNTTSAVDAIQFKMDSGNIDAGTIKLYGIKDS